VDKDDEKSPKAVSHHGSENIIETPFAFSKGTERFGLLMMTKFLYINLHDELRPVTSRYINTWTN
jgi:hypothetical protein